MDTNHRAYSIVLDVESIYELRKSILFHCVNEYIRGHCIGGTLLRLIILYIFIGGVQDLYCLHEFIGV